MSSKDIKTTNNDFESKDNKMPPFEFVDSN
jgi:hypothetical protein